MAMTKSEIATKLAEQVEISKKQVNLFFEAQAKLASIEETTKVQASNHLHHLEEEAYKHTAALDKQTTILERIEAQGVSTGAKFDTLIAVMRKQ